MSIISLPQIQPPAASDCSVPAPAAPVRSNKKIVKLSQLRPGETARILRVDMADTGCRKRFAELGLAEGMKVSVAGTGDTLMLVLGNARMGLAARCADEITVMRL